MLNLILRVASRGLEQIEPLRPPQCLKDIIDAPAQILPAPVRHQALREPTALDGEEGAIGVRWVLLEEASDELEIRGGKAFSVELA
jgi:hypothetical protein